MYQRLMNRANEALEKAKTASDTDMRAFFYAVYRGYVIKAQKLTVGEA